MNSPLSKGMIRHDVSVRGPLAARTIRLAIIALAAMAVSVCTGAPVTERQQAHARAVTIFRDDWGIAHVFGKTDADAVFGMIYAQAEDDFGRVENNYLL